MPTIHLCSSPVVEVNRFGGHLTYSVSPMDDVLPREAVECAALPDVLAAFATYTDKVKATGKPAHVAAYFPRQAARKPRGFDAAKRSDYVNVPTE